MEGCGGAGRDDGTEQRKRRNGAEDTTEGCAEGAGGSLWRCREVQRRRKDWSFRVCLAFARFFETRAQIVMCSFSHTPTLDFNEICRCSALARQGLREKRTKTHRALA